MAPVCGSYTRHLFIILVTSVICFLFLHFYIRYNDQGLLDSVIPMQDQQFSVSHFFNVNDRLTCVDPRSERGVEDTLCVQRPQYLPSYKNPCWLDSGPYNGLKRLRCLPYFHVLGVDKSGSTDLFSRITQHPQVLANSGGLGKETYYWCWLKYGQWMKGVVRPQPFVRYLRYFDEAAATIYHGFHTNGSELITGDGTPMDFWDFRAWTLIPQNKGLTEPAILTPHLMRHLYRDPKFIIILRNPTERLYSDYLFLGYGWSPEKFRDDVPRAIDMMQRCLKVNSTRQCVFSNHTYVEMPMRLHIGMYSVFMKEWLAVFPRSSFHILRTEDFAQNMTLHLRLIYKFLGLEPLTDQQIEKIASMTRKHETEIKKEVEDMYPETRAQLDQFYAGYKEELATMLDDRSFLWHRLP
ncbi:carbohydrate sulfotransferase 15-like [Pomacea canaliculata]|uniref:carbohydrate sulfotransferase 15-like n=1 Tax=Pomacea canaliculata TaxID=400727 RepID=UPI000D729B22|nr:carbohydrate sulfotransferase 15-like [Pomacea canaliculata]